MLIRHDIVLVLRVRRLVLRQHVDVLDGQERGDQCGGRGAVGYRCVVVGVRVRVWLGVVLASGHGGG